MKNRRWKAIAASCLLAATSLPATAQKWPERAVRVVVPFGPGGGTDIIARLVSARLTEEFGQQFIVDNRAGAGGTIGAESVARATPDGYTLIVVSTSYATNAALYKLPYDPVTGIAPVTQLGRTAELLVVHPSVPARTLKELIALARARPGELNYASSGVGGFTHLETELFNQMARVEMTHVPYKGTGLALADLVGGQIHMTFGSAPSTLPFVKQGKVRALGVAASQRLPSAPEVPAIGEIVPGYVAELWYGFWAPAGTPKPVLDQLNQALGRVLASTAVRDRLVNDFDVQPAHTSPEAFAKFIAAEIEKWRRVVRTGNIKLN